MIPRIEDGNNFGVSIQEEALSEVSNLCFDELGIHYLLVMGVNDGMSEGLMDDSCVRFER